MKFNFNQVQNIDINHLIIELCVGASQPARRRRARNEFSRLMYININKEQKC